MQNVTFRYKLIHSDKCYAAFINYGIEVKGELWKALNIGSNLFYLKNMKVTGKEDIVGIKWS